MNEQKTNAGQGLGIAGFVLGVIALIISFIPCIGIYALVPGIIAIILSAIGYSQASKSNGPKGLIIAALVVSILGTLIAGWQYYAISHVANSYVDEMENFSNDFKDVLDSEDGDDTLNASTLVSGADKLDEFIEEEDYDKVIDVYEETIDKYIEKLKDINEGDMSNIGEKMAAVTMVTAVTVKMATVLPFFSDEQRERFDAIQKKYDDMEKE